MSRVAKKPRIPAPEDLTFCATCGLNTNGKGYHGPQCQCSIDLRKSARSHSIKTRPGDPWGPPPQ